MKHAPDALMIAGATAISASAGMVYLPAGLFTAGVFLLVAGWMAAREAAAKAGA